VSFTLLFTKPNPSTFANTNGTSTPRSCVKRREIEVEPGLMSLPSTSSLGSTAHFATFVFTLRG
jgi:hypothetical protein